MWKAVLIAMTPFLLAGMNHYFRHKRMQQEDEAEDRQRERRRQPKVTYDHQWDDDD